MGYLLKRLSQSVVTVLAVITLSFGLIRLMPGGPTDALRAQLRQNNPSITEAQIQSRIEAELSIAPDEPLYVQYFDYVTGVVTGDLGTSTYYDTPVVAELANVVPWTVFLMSVSIFLMFVLGVTVGAFMAYREGSPFDIGMTGFGLVLNSTPNYVIGLLLITFVGYRLELFPTGGRIASDVVSPYGIQYVVSVLYHAALPIGAMVLQGFGGWALNMRGNSIRILGDEYLRGAWLRGLGERRIAMRYVARNAILPMYTGLLISIGFMFGGAVIIEEIFRYPGMGKELLDAVHHRDYPMMMGTFMVITLSVVVGITFADLTYSKIDPRASTGDSSESY